MTNSMPGVTKKFLYASAGVQVFCGPGKRLFMKYAMFIESNATVQKPMKSGRIGSHILFALVLLAGCVTAQAQETTAEQQRTAQELDRVRSDPLALRDFLKRMPKGGDLHNHLDGAVYAETFIRVGGEDGLCVVQEVRRHRSSPSRGRVPA